MDTYREIVARHGPTEFVGYTDTTAETDVLSILDNGGPVVAAGEGQEIELALRRSPCYAEAGGQVGDIGRLRTAEGGVVDITDTRYGLDGLHIHTGRVTAGEVRVGQPAEATVDGAHRAAVARSHSATHILHAMLRRTLGDHARQQGSLVAPGRLRFDFAHFSTVDESQLASIGALVNDYLLGDPEVRVWHASRAEAEAAGATAFFGEKYGDRVRIVDIGDASRELCGGTHVGHGTQAGPVRILGESSIGAGLRRIEALTGRDALVHADRERQILAEVGRLVGARPDDLLATLRKRLTALAEAEEALRRQRDVELDAMATGIAKRRRSIGQGWLVAARLDEVASAELRPLATAVLARGPAGQPGVVVLAIVNESKAQLVAAIGAELTGRGLRARDVLAGAAEAIGGGAGGTGGVASAGGRRTSELPEALGRAEAAAAALLAGDGVGGSPR
jgi:alanyl-tRNA synthetase